MDILSKHIESGQPKTTPDICRKLLELGDFEQFRKAFLMGYHLDLGIFNRVVESGSLDTLRLLVIHGVSKVLIEGVDGLSYISYKISDGEYSIGTVSLTPYKLRIAAASGHLHICKWIHEMGLLPNDSVEFLIGGAICGRVDMMEWANSTHPLIGDNSTTIWYYAARKSNMDVLRWALHNNISWGDGGSHWLSDPIKDVSPDVTMWLKTNGCPYDFIE